MLHPARFTPYARSAFLLLFLLCATAVHAQWTWEPLNDGLQEIHITSIVHDLHGRIVLATAHGIYKYDEDYIETTGSPWLRTDSTIRYAELTRISDGTIFARTQFGMFISKDEGLSWGHLNDNPYAVLGALNDSTYAWGSGNRFDFVRGDSSWGGNMENDIFHIAFGVDGTIYVALKNNYMNVSTNSGRLWQQLDGPDIENSLFNFITDFQAIGSDTLIAVMYYGAFRSSDGGKSWNHIHDSIYEINFGDDGILYGFGPGTRTADPYDAAGILYRSSDAGLTWQEHGAYHIGNTNTELADLRGFYHIGSFAADSEGKLVQGLYGQLYRSADSGLTWHGSGENLKNIHVKDLAYDTRSNSIYMTTSRELVAPVSLNQVITTEHHSLFRLDDEGVAWIPIQDTISYFVGIDSTGNIYALAENYVSYPDDPYRIKSHIILSHDRGATWEELDSVTNNDPTTFKVFSSAAGVSVIGTVDFSYTPFIFTSDVDFSSLSIDSGKTWKNVAEWLLDTLGTMQAFHILEDGTILISDVVGAKTPTYRFWKYNPFSEEITLIDTTYMGFLVPDHNGGIYSNRNRMLHYSSDQGITWSPVPTPTSSFVVKGLKIGMANELYLRGRTTSSPQDTIYRSSDMGSTWHVLRFDQPELKDHNPQIPALCGRDVLVDSISGSPETIGINSPGERFNKFGWSTDGGQTWMLDHGTLVDKSLSAILLVDGHDLLIGTKEDGVYRISHFLSVEEREGTTSPQLALHVIPTPTINGGATMFFHLAHSVDVRVELFNALGRSTGIVFQNQLEAGEHRLPVELKELTPGTYFLRLTAGKETGTTKLVVR